ncbi:MAG: phosphocholine cytidylyltransferase family protein [Eubacteriales bacterium]|nr:phosphocholine cytidylyltransferase family protein [Eubacteriales bacterium]
MKCLILAAGRGTRISRFLGGAPKCTVDLGGIPLIRHTVEALQREGVTDIALAVGYQQDVIRQVLHGLEVQYFHNPFYDVTNSIASAWFARDFLKDDDVMIMNGDVFLEDALLTQVLGEPKSPVMFADDSRREEADYKFFYRNGLLEKYGKELSGADITGEYIGLAKLSRQHLPSFVRRLETMIAQSQHSLWWENVLYAHLDEQPVYVENTDERFWAEVDYVEDYERILAFLKEHPTRAGGRG